MSSGATPPVDPAAGTVPWTRRTVTPETIAYLTELGAAAAAEVAAEARLPRLGAPATIDISHAAGSDPDAVLAKYLAGRTSASAAKAGAAKPGASRTRRWW
jgi:hypothetical protein